MKTAPQQVDTAVIPVAGLGTRFLPATKFLPKEMLPVLDRPCIDYVVEEALNSGISRIVFVTARGKESIVDYFGPNSSLEAHLKNNGKTDLLDRLTRSNLEVDVLSTRQRNPKGLGHAVLTARAAVGEVSFAVLLPDEILVSQSPTTHQLVQTRTQEDQAVIGLMKIDPSHTDRYGICAGPFLPGGRMQVDTMVEKPHPSCAPGDHAIIGRYVVPGDIFEILADTKPGTSGEIQFTDALSVLAGRGRVTGLVCDGQRFDTGNVLGLLRASMYMAANRDDLREDFLTIISEITHQ